MTSHNAERKSEGGCSTRRECLLSVDSVWSEYPLFSLHGGLIHPKCLQLCLNLVIWMESRRHLHCLHSDMQWWHLHDGLDNMQQLHSSMFFQQWNDLLIQHFMLIARCSKVHIYEDNVSL